MKIINNTNLDYSTIDLLIDHVIKNSHDDTHYYGQVEHCKIIVHNVTIKIQIRYLKRYVEWSFDYE